jgi:hypothetical protein
MIDTGHKIALEVNKVSKSGGFNNVTLEADENNFFCYSDPCVWSNVISLDDCIRLIKRQMGMNYSTSFDKYFWENNREMLRSYFFPGKLTFWLAEIFNAPLEEIMEEFPRSSLMMTSVAKRCSGVTTSTVNGDAFSYASNQRQASINPAKNISYWMPKDYEFLHSYNTENANNETKKMFKFTVIDSNGSAVQYFSDDEGQNKNETLLSNRAVHKSLHKKSLFYM